jgi:hypothetical protein
VPIPDAIAGDKVTALPWQSAVDLSGTYVLSRVLEMPKPVPTPNSNNAEDALVERVLDDVDAQEYAQMQLAWAMRESASGLSSSSSSSSYSSSSSSSSSPYSFQSSPMALFMSPMEQPRASSAAATVAATVPLRAAQESQPQRLPPNATQMQHGGNEQAQHDGLVQAQHGGDEQAQHGGNEQAQHGGNEQLPDAATVAADIAKAMQMDLVPDARAGDPFQPKVTQLATAARATLVTMSGSAPISGNNGRSTSNDSQSAALQELLQRKNAAEKEKEEAERATKAAQQKAEREVKSAQQQAARDVKIAQQQAVKQVKATQRLEQQEAARAAGVGKRKPASQRGGGGGKKKAKSSDVAADASEQNQIEYAYKAAQIVQVDPDDDSPSFKISIRRLPELTADNRDEIAALGKEAVEGLLCSACLQPWDHHNRAAVKCMNEWPGEDGESVVCDRRFNRKCIRDANGADGEWCRYFDKNKVPLSKCPLCETCVGCWQAFDGAETRQCDLCSVFFCERCHDVDGPEAEFYCRACTGAQPAAAAAAAAAAANSE